MNKFLPALIALGLLLAIGLVVGMMGDFHSPYSTPPEPPARQPLDTSGGQQMQPRWSAGEGE